MKRKLLILLLILLTAASLTLPVLAAKYGGADSDVGSAIAIRVACMLLIPLAITFIVIAILNRMMRSVAAAAHAADYMDGSLNLTGHMDNYTHTTTTRRRRSNSNAGA